MVLSSTDDDDDASWSNLPSLSVVDDDDEKDDDDEREDAGFSVFVRWPQKRRRRDFDGDGWAACPMRQKGIDVVLR